MRAPDFWYGQGASASLTAALLSPLGVLYGAIGRLRRAVVQPYDCGRPVVCVGNLVAGGAGKTPVALSLVTALQRRGLSVHCLSRGYGGRESGPLRVDREHHSYREVGDEPLLLAAQAPTWIARDRAAGARAAVTAGAEVIVMDDGFQNPSVKKTLSLLVIDGAVGLGNGRLIPAGPLREAPSAGLARAQAAVILGQDRRGLASQLPTQLPVLDAALMPPAKGWTPAGQRFLAFAGIGRPEKFFTTLEALGAELVDRQAFADHHPYSGEEIIALQRRAEAQEARLITTEKDHLRLPPPVAGAVLTLPVAVAWKDSQALEMLLREVVTS